MNELVINIPAIAALCWMVSQYIAPPVVSFVMKLDRRYRAPVKPFECAFCLTFWTAWFIFVINYGCWGMAYACLSAVVAAIIDRKL